MDVTVTMVEHHIWLIGQLIDRSERYEHVLDEPVGSSPGLDENSTVGGVLNLLVGQLEMWLDAVDGRPSMTDAGITPSDLRKRLAEAGPRFAMLTRRVVAEGRETELFRAGPADHPNVFGYGGMIAHVLAFGAYRRALVIGALAASGAGDLHNGDPMLYFAERSTGA